MNIRVRLPIANTQSYNNLITNQKKETAMARVKLTRELDSVWGHLQEREERRKSLEPSRVQYATDLLIEAMYAVGWNANEKAIYISIRGMTERTISQNYIHIQAGGRARVSAQEEVFIN